ncbi:MAG: phycobilisome rod-core linker polypeptide [Xenococcaceae cyanobacterium MO_207.B15]|nr:phycobilisome rod-core linker polypeptide [Xenococcaceae cyanobacterium MO_207.B15]
MNNTFISPVITNASELGVSFYEDSDRLELYPKNSVEEVETVIRAVYRQVLGNAYVMESERLSIPESQLKQGEISIREFVRQVAKSELYRSRFADNCPRYRSIELNFKHLLGRAPESYAEMQAHSQILDESGFEADIDSYIDSDEYQDNYGENIVPYYRGYKTQTGKSMVGFTHLFQILRGASSSDKNLVQGNYSRLNSSIISNTPSRFIPPSTSNSYGGITDISKLIANAVSIKNTIPVSIPSGANNNLAFSGANYELQQKDRQQKQKIEELEQKLKNIRPFAAIGAAELNKYQSQSAEVDNNQTIPQNNNYGIYRDLKRQTEEQEKIIANLENKLADAQRFASIGEARLNKWRNRVFF